MEPSKVQMAEAIQLFSKGCQRRRTFAQEERLPAEEKAHGKKPRGAQHREQANNLVGLVAQSCVKAGHQSADAGTDDRVDGNSGPPQRA